MIILDILRGALAIVLIIAATALVLYFVVPGMPAAGEPRSVRPLVAVLGGFALLILLFVAAVATEGFWIGRS